MLCVPQRSTSASTCITCLCQLSTLGTATVASTMQASLLMTRSVLALQMQRSHLVMWVLSEQCSWVSSNARFTLQMGYWNCGMPWSKWLSWLRHSAVPTGECCYSTTNEASPFHISSTVLVIIIVPVKAKNQEEWDECSMCHAWGRCKMHTGFRCENVKEGDRLEDLGSDGKTVLKCIIKKNGGRVWIGLIWLSLGISGTLL